MCFSTQRAFVDSLSSFVSLTSSVKLDSIASSSSPAVYLLRSFFAIAHAPRCSKCGSANDPSLPLPVSVTQRRGVENANLPKKNNHIASIATRKRRRSTNETHKKHKPSADALLPDFRAATVKKGIRPHSTDARHGARRVKKAQTVQELRVSHLLA